MIATIAGVIRFVAIVLLLQCVVVVVVVGFL